MRIIISTLILIVLTLALAGGLSYGAMSRGIIKPPSGSIRVGQLTVMALPPCPTQPGNLFGPGRRCGAASPWAVWAVWRDQAGTPRQWKIITLVFNGG